MLGYANTLLEFSALSSYASTDQKDLNKTIIDIF